jgi:hypothetical protein
MADAPSTTTSTTTPAATYDLRDAELTPTAARAVARAVVLQERARAAAQRRRRGFGLRAPASMPHSGLVRRRAARVA